MTIELRQWQLSDAPAPECREKRPGGGHGHVRPDPTALHRPPPDPRRAARSPDPVWEVFSRYEALVR